VQEAYVRTLAQEAGFEFVAASDLNANARDTRDHPFGVWTLPPTLRTSPLGARRRSPNFDTAPYEAIGESDRMTLKFRKPSGLRRRRQPAIRPPNSGLISKLTLPSLLRRRRPWCVRWPPKATKVRRKLP
jgi:hypothetical protein